MIEPDDAGVAKRRQECDVARPLSSQPVQQLAGRMLGPHDFRHQEREGDREHAVTECLQPVGFRQAYLWPRANPPRAWQLLELPARWLIGRTSKRNQFTTMTGVNLGRHGRSSLVLSPHACVGNGGSSLFPEGKMTGIPATSLPRYVILRNRICRWCGQTHRGTGGGRRSRRQRMSLERMSTAKTSGEGPQTRASRATTLRCGVAQLRVPSQPALAQKRLNAGPPQNRR
jgi:hypothetical protein